MADVNASPDSVRVWRAGNALCMHGTTSSYAVDPNGECVVGVVLAGGMEVRRGGERHRFGPGDICAWDPSAPHAGRPLGCERWEARLVVIELAALEDIVRDPDGAPRDVELATPRVRDQRLAQGFVALHMALEAPAWALDREVALSEWLHELTGGPAEPLEARAARRDPALRHACELLHEDLGANVTLAQLAAGAGVSRHRLTRLFRAAYGLPPHRFALAQRIRLARRLLERGVAPGDVAQRTGFFDQSHLHRHLRRTLGMTPGRYAQLARSDIQDARPIAP
jgi:AraC-like DNA-binding protein